jgi:UDP-N-acetylglucosamine 2-epimerase
LADKKSDVLARLGLESRKFALATVHRPANTDNVERLENLLNLFNEIAESHYPVVFPMHPRTAHRLPGMLPNWKAHPNLKLIEPVGYLDMMQLLGHARLAFTDSGGLQKEAFFLNCPCITLRDETEWVETVMAGGNVVVGADPQRIRQAFEDWQLRFTEGEIDFSADIPPYFGNGDAAERILKAIVSFLQPVAHSAV